MTELAPWIQIVIMILGTLGGSYIGSLLAVTRLEEKHKALVQDITTEIKPRIQELGKRSHKQQEGILLMDGRLCVMEDRIGIKYPRRHHDFSIEGDE